MGGMTVERAGRKKGRDEVLILCRYDVSHFRDIKYGVSLKGHRIGAGTQISDL